MAIVETIRVGGDKLSASNSGKMAINQTTGEITVRGVDSNSVLVRIDATGMTYSEPTGIRRIRLGAHPVDGHIGEWVSKNGVDVIETLGGR